MAHKAPDRTDMKILDVLQQDARITNQALAERVALSPSACLARVRALETRGLIRAYRAHVAVDRIRSVTIVLAQVSFKQHALEEFTEFDRRILRMPEVVEACRVSGAYDYLLRVIVNDVHHWKDIARLLLGGDYGVEKIVSHFLMDEVKPFTGYPLTSS
ncbi:Lrp/AsnC family transcriptional regulator [Pseudoxanthomonas indica]|uniref:Transcriptional regulator, AsnC family n=1 Tax=Pseudoxanthomonas indica TaxID=428993 RepID=A0A1T5IKG9_9GAMM|nr:Lrp/AsnC family transcriptional regulator [Pseudoxanthomonas indica]GGD52686.1 Lrp-family transcriptional regulator [Pseudoxanthomonas indica]SKC39639.1 transcriptional regulator, AsnC family [Pseudoxanthomonas indica]HVL08361.1 Lrp/AsnC family transcriptional regulator [Burkholderiaceae bacterium]